MDRKRSLRQRRQYRPAMHDLARYDRGYQSPDEIGAFRRRTEQRLDRMLRQCQSFLTIVEVKALIFEADLPQFRTYLAALLAALGYDRLADADDEVQQVIQDAWNYFPHRFLAGHCPAETFYFSE